MRPYALVTGATRGLGRLFALALAKRGHPLLLTGRDSAALQRVREEVLQQTAVPIQLCAADLATSAGVQALFASSVELPIQVVVNNAGFGLGGPFTAHADEALAAMLRLNVEGFTRIAHHYLPELVRHRGVLLQLASQAAFQPIPYLAAYAASKAYVLHLTEALQREMHGSGVRIVAVCPAPTQTDFFRRAGIDLGKTRFAPMQPEQVVKAALRAADRGTPVALPGLHNKLASWGSRLLPRRWAVRAAEAAVWRR